mgnify:CR=1 FL=1
MQIAEITCYDARPADYPVKNSPDVAFPPHRLERDWLYQDAGLDIARVIDRYPNPCLLGDHAVDAMETAL